MNAGVPEAFRWTRASGYRSIGVKESGLSFQELRGGGDGWELVAKFENTPARGFGQALGFGLERYLSRE